MKKWQISVIFVILAVLIIGTVSADTPITVGAGWTVFQIPPGTPPVASPQNSFTYSSELPTHVMITDVLCVGDQPAVYEGGTMLGAGTPVVRDPDCSPSVGDPDVAYAGDVYSHACINMGAGEHAFDIKNIQMWDVTEGDGGYVKVEEGVCPGTPEAPEFPSIALPIGMILGLVFIVYSLQTRKE
jgi:hypothetical protein